jgi:hypothetical protein
MNEETNTWSIENVRSNSTYSYESYWFANRCSFLVNDLPLIIRLDANYCIRVSNESSTLCNAVSLSQNTIHFVRVKQDRILDGIIIDSTSPMSSKLPRFGRLIAIFKINSTIISRWAHDYFVQIFMNRDLFEKNWRKITYFIEIASLLVMIS